MTKDYLTDSSLQYLGKVMTRAHTEYKRIIDDVEIPFFVEFFRGHQVTDNSSNSHWYKKMTKNVHRFCAARSINNGMIYSVSFLDK